MAISPVMNLQHEEGVISPPDYFETLWYAAHVCANHERRVLEQLAQRSVEAFVPVYQTWRIWKDRRVRLARPLFPGYVFVHLALRDRFEVTRVSSVVRLVGFNGRASALPDSAVETLKRGMAAGVHGEPYPYLTAGRRVRLKSGPLAGMQGILLRRKGNFRLVISIELIQRAVVVDVDAANVELLR